MSAARAQQIHSAMADAIGRKDHKALMQHAGQMLRAASGMASASDAGVGLPPEGVPPAPSAPVSPAVPKPPTPPSPPTMSSTGRKGHGVGNFIQGAIKHPGALHRELGVPQGQKIPAAKLNAAAHSSNPTERKRANLAKTLKKLNHK